jgi:vacuolar protein sorting-associated protein 45
MRHLKCICLVRPTPDSIQHLVNELREPKYGEYYIYFSNIVKKSSLERLAEADDHEVVKSVQEFYADYLAISRDLWSVCYGREVAGIFGLERDSWNAEAFDQTTQGIIALLLSVKKKPLIRYERNSNMAKKLGMEIQVRTLSLHRLIIVSINTRKAIIRFQKSGYSAYTTLTRSSE